MTTTRTVDGSRWAMRTRSRGPVPVKVFRILAPMTVAGRSTKTRGVGMEERSTDRDYDRFGGFFGFFRFGRFLNDLHRPGDAGGSRGDAQARNYWNRTMYSLHVRIRRIPRLRVSA